MGRGDGLAPLKCPFAAGARFRVCSARHYPFLRGHVTATNPAAGKPVDSADLVNVPRLVTAYFASKPDPADPAQRVAFGTSGHRGSSLKNSFNENHILATTQAICDYRRETGLTGPLFVGIDTHALAEAGARKRGRGVCRQRRRHHDR